MAHKRRPYRGQGDESGDDDVGVDEFLDEQEQEQLIEKLGRENDERNNFFTLAFTILSLLPTIFYVLRIFYGNFNMLDALSISSLLMTAYTMYYIPLNTKAYANHPLVELSPTQQYIPTLNAVLVGLITFSVVVGRKSKYELELYFRFMPLIVWVFVSLGKQAMGSVNVGELEGLKYKYKGA